MRKPTYAVSQDVECFGKDCQSRHERFVTTFGCCRANLMVFV